MLTFILFGILICLTAQSLYKKYKAAKEQSDYLDSLARNWDYNIRRQSDFINMD